MKSDRELRTVFAELQLNGQADINEHSLKKVIEHYDIPIWPALETEEKVTWCQELIHVATKSDKCSLSFDDFKGAARKYPTFRALAEEVSDEISTRFEIDEELERLRRPIRHSLQTYSIESIQPSLDITAIQNESEETYDTLRNKMPKQKDTKGSMGLDTSRTKKESLIPKCGCDESCTIMQNLLKMNTNKMNRQLILLIFFLGVVNATMQFYPIEDTKRKIHQFSAMSKDEILKNMDEIEPGLEHYLEQWEEALATPDQPELLTTWNEKFESELFVPFDILKIAEKVCVFNHKHDKCKQRVFEKNYDPRDPRIVKKYHKKIDKEIYHMLEKESL